MKWLLYYLLFQLCLSTVLWLYSKRKDKRYKTNDATLSEDFIPTQEVSIDPVSKVLKRVYVHSRTGERRYVEEKKQKPVVKGQEECRRKQ
ncbi:hypothetical protein [Heyndrickxia acidicola]|uniref:Uncharacterized protein n=1 Tax=Heyndrickxia acidicola TaxID=209389 RepID=A0ABU6MFM5_9BACI|nr:hypothetical protein [Heyndrickxia acidicola]MED1203270.1 hypothetical protein [Heyndrickxia acidicola]